MNFQKRKYEKKGIYIDCLILAKFLFSYVYQAQLLTDHLLVSILGIDVLKIVISGFMVVHFM